MCAALMVRNVRSDIRNNIGFFKTNLLRQLWVKSQVKHGTPPYFGVILAVDYLFLGENRIENLGHAKGDSSIPIPFDVKQKPTYMWAVF